MTIARRLRLVRCARQARLSQGLTGRYARFLLEELIRKFRRAAGSSTNPGSGATIRKPDDPLVAGGGCTP